MPTLLAFLAHIHECEIPTGSVPPIVQISWDTACYMDRPLDINDPLHLLSHVCMLVNFDCLISKSTVFTWLVSWSSSKIPLCL